MTAREGHSQRAGIDLRIVVALALYATREGIGSAREGGASNRCLTPTCGFSEGPVPLPQPVGLPGGSSGKPSTTGLRRLLAC